MKNQAIFLILLVILTASAFADTTNPANKEAEKHFEKANKLLKRMDYEGAIDEYSKVINLSSSDKAAQDAQYWIGQSQFRAGKFDAAQATFAKLIKQYPTSAIIPVTKLMVERVEKAKENEKIKTALDNAADKGFIIDPKTGVRYTKTASFTGKNDVIKWSSGLDLSPNGKFLLHEGIVIPLDGSEPFDLVDTSAGRGVWSPDGTQVAFYLRRAICIVPVSPQTGRATGPIQKLLEGRYEYQPPVSWSSDGRKLIFGRYDREHSGEIWTLSVTDGSLTPGELPIKRRQRSSPDGRWILYETDGTHLLNVDDNRKLDISPPPQQVGSFFSWSPDGKKMLFYRESYDLRYEIRVLSGSGGPSASLEGPTKSWPEHQWSFDSKAILVTGYKDGHYGVWISPLSGGSPVLLKVEVSVGGKPLFFEVSPTGDLLAFVVDREGEIRDLYVVPVSLKDASTTGPAIKVFEGWHPRYASDSIYMEASWSPDGTKLAVVHGKDLWIAFSNGDKPVPLIQGIEAFYPGWSPDGTMVDYMAWPKEDPQGGLYVIPSRGGSPTKIPAFWDNSVWSPDSKKIAVVSKDLVSISIVTVKGNQNREIANVKDLGLDRFTYLTWSPDGKYIACTGHYKNEPGAIILIPLEGGKPTMFAADDDSWKTCLQWSPDGKWISYRAGEYAKVRPEGTLWEADFDEVVKKASR